MSTENIGEEPSEAKNAISNLKRSLCRCLLFAFPLGLSACSVGGIGDFQIDPHRSEVYDSTSKKSVTVNGVGVGAHLWPGGASSRGGDRGPFALSLNFYGAGLREDTTVGIRALHVSAGSKTVFAQEFQSVAWSMDRGLKGRTIEGVRCANAPLPTFDFRAAFKIQEHRPGQAVTVRATVMVTQKGGSGVSQEVTFRFHAKTKRGLIQLYPAT